MNNFSFRPNTYNNNPNSFESSFSTNTPLISKSDFKNQNNVLHNNLGDILRNENKVDYIIYINSSNRDIPTYPSVFNFSTVFGALSKYSNTNIDSLGNQVITYGTNEPVIERNFLNVVNVELGFIYLPRTNIIKSVVNLDSTISYMLSPDDEDNFNKKRFLILNIKELASPRLYSTGHPISNISFILNRDSGRDEQLWKCYVDSRTYPLSLLKKIDKLTLQLCDDEGNEIRVMCNNQPFDIERALKSDPNNISLKNISKTMQTNYQFTFCVIENELNTLTKYDH